MYNRQIYCKGWTPWFKTICLCKGINKLQEVRIILCFLRNQDHTSDRHFCSLIDEFPVWNSEPDQPTMMSWATPPEREKVWELLHGCLTHWWSLATHLWEVNGEVAVWVVIRTFSLWGTPPFYIIWCYIKIKLIVDILRVGIGPIFCYVNIQKPKQKKTLV